MIGKVAFIPTQSLFQIEEKCNDRLDSKIILLKARNRWQLPTEREVVNEYMTIGKASGYMSLDLRYNLKRCKQQISLPQIVEQCSEMGAYDLFIDRIGFLIKMKKGLAVDPIKVFFENSPPRNKSILDLIVRSRKRFLKKRGFSQGEDFHPPRMLQFFSVTSLEDHDRNLWEFCNEPFIRYLDSELQGNGLIMGTEARDVSKEVEVHEGFELYGICWQDEVMELA